MVYQKITDIMIPTTCREQLHIGPQLYIPSIKRVQHPKTSLLWPGFIICAGTLISRHGSERLQAGLAEKKMHLHLHQWFCILSAQLATVFPPWHKWNPKECKHLVDLGQQQLKFTARNVRTKWADGEANCKENQGFANIPIHYSNTKQLFLFIFWEVYIKLW